MAESTAISTAGVLGPFADLSRIEIKGERVAKTDLMSPRAIEGVRTVMSRLGIVGKRFNEKMQDLQKNIAKDDHKPFHAGLKCLGELLGFDGDMPDGNATPDGVWSLDDLVHIALEAKTEEESLNPISVSDVTQATRHLNWLKANRECGTSSRLVSVLVSPRTTIDKDAVIHAQGVHYISAKDLRALATRVVAVLQSLRAEWLTSNDEAMSERILERMRTEKLLPEDILGLLTEMPAAKLPSAR